MWPKEERLPGAEPKERLEENKRKNKKIKKKTEEKVKNEKSKIRKRGGGASPGRPSGGESRRSGWCAHPGEGNEPGMSGNEVAVGRWYGALLVSPILVRRPRMPNGARLRPTTKHLGRGDATVEGRVED